VSVGVAINPSSNAIFVMIIITTLVQKSVHPDNKDHYGVAKHVTTIKKRKRMIKIII